MVDEWRFHAFLVAVARISARSLKLLYRLVLHHRQHGCSGTNLREEFETNPTPHNPTADIPQLQWHESPRGV